MLVLLQLSDNGKFLSTEDRGLLSAQAFVRIWTPLFGPEGLRFMPFPGTYMEQPDELMEILRRIGNALIRA